MVTLYQNYTQISTIVEYQASEIKDWRKIFSYVPLPEGCTKETLTIPNTSGSIDWEGKSATPSPTLVPIDPNFAS